VGRVGTKTKGADFKEVNVNTLSEKIKRQPLTKEDILDKLDQIMEREDAKSAEYEDDEPLLSLSDDEKKEEFAIAKREYSDQSITDKVNTSKIDLREAAESYMSSDLVSDSYYSGGLTPSLDNYVPKSLKLNEKELTVVRAGMRSAATGLRTSIPMTCQAEECSFKKQCPFYKIGKLPEDLPCPIESMLMDLYTKRYIDEFSVLETDMGEVSVVQMLAATHVLEMRAFKLLGELHPTGIIENIVGASPSGELEKQIQEHPAYNHIERAWRWRKNLLESMMGTRKDKFKREQSMKESGDLSIFNTAADIKAKIDKLAALRDDDIESADYIEG